MSMSMSVYAYVYVCVYVNLSSSVKANITKNDICFYGKGKQNSKL
jgi:hypothetical protein